MGTDIFYFTGTGNSLVVARDIVKKIGANLIPIPSVMNAETIIPSADRIGIVFPVYLGGVPRIVKRFVKKLNNLESKYIFAVCTYENTTGAVFKILSNEIRKRRGELSAGFAVKMPGSYIVGGEPIAASQQQLLFSNWKTRLPEIISYVEERKKGRLEKYSDAGSRIGDMILSSVLINRLLSRMYLSRDKNFYTNDSCDGCGICARLCPVDNIEMIDSRPCWLHHCEQCFACLHWCPKEAIQYKIHAPFIRPGGPQANMTENRSRYHHPDVRLVDIVNQKT